MAEPRPTTMEPPVEQLLQRVTIVTLAVKRGREINSYRNQLGEAIGTIVPPLVASRGLKPLSIPLEGIAVGLAPSSDGVGRSPAGQ